MLNKMDKAKDSKINKIKDDTRLGTKILFFYLMFVFSRYVNK
jgi:hypothetical protein